MSQTSEILDIVRSIPGSSLADIKNLMSANYKNPSAQVSLLVSQGRLVSKLGPNKKNVYFIGDGKPPIPKSAIAKNPIAAPKANESAELKELREWKAWAIGIYPDLGVPPNLKRAREYAISFYEKVHDSQKINDIKAGKMDNTPLIQVALMAIEA